MANNTSIRLKRSAKSFADIKQEELFFGEPLFIDNGADGEKLLAYLAVGPENNADVEHSPVFKAFTKDKADSIVFNINNSLVGEDGTPISVSRVNADGIETLPASSGKYHILVQKEGTDEVSKFILGDSGIYITENGVMHGAAWNDYAEVRNVTSEVTPGTVVCEDGFGALTPSTEKFQPCAYVVSDTYGFSLGNPDRGTAAVAVAGRVLVDIDDEVKVGDVLTAGPNGKAVVMTRQEIAFYPDRMLGIVTEVPTYEVWNGVEVKGRIWMKVL